MASPWSRCGKRLTSRVWSLIAFCMLDHARPPLSCQEHTHCDVKSICPALKVYLFRQTPSKYWTIETFSPYKNQMARYLYRVQRDGDQVSIKTVFFYPLLLCWRISSPSGRLRHQEGKSLKNKGRYATDLVANWRTEKMLRTLGHFWSL